MIDITAYDSFHAYGHSIPVSGMWSGDFLLPMRSVETLIKVLPKANIALYQTSNGYSLFRHQENLAVWIAPFNGSYPDILSLMKDGGQSMLRCSRTTLGDALKIGAILSANNVLKLEQRDDSVYASFPRNVTDSDVYLDGAIVEGALEPTHLSIPFLSHCLESVKGDELFLRRMKMGAIRITGPTPTPFTMLQIIKYSSTD